MKLFLSDFDGTLVSKDLLDVMCGIVGKEQESMEQQKVAIKEGFKTYNPLMKRINFLKDVTLEQINNKLDENNYLFDGTIELFKFLKENGYKTVLHTGNIFPVAQYYQNLLGIDFLVCTRPKMDGNKIVGIELADFGAHGFKARGCQEIIDRFKVKKDNIVAIGDSIVDLPMFELAGKKIAINAKEGIEKHADFEIKNQDLRDAIGFLKHFEC